MLRIKERDLILPAIRIIKNRGGEILTSELIDELQYVFRPKGEDAKILKNRNDNKLSQKIRNLKSHKTLKNLGFVREFEGGFSLTDYAYDYLKVA